MTFGGISEASGSAASSWKMSQSARYAERPHDARKYSIHGGNVAPIHGTVNASRYVGWRSPGRAGRASSAAAASAALSSADVGDGEDGARAPNFRSLPVPCRHGLVRHTAPATHRPSRTSQARVSKDTIEK